MPVVFLHLVLFRPNNISRMQAGPCTFTGDEIQSGIGRMSDEKLDSNTT